MKSYRLAAFIAAAGCSLALSGCGTESEPARQGHRLSIAEAQRIRMQASQPTNPNGRFGRGSTDGAVKAVMGRADDEQTMHDGRTVWYYRSSAVTFRKGRVVEWADYSRTLKTHGPGDVLSRPQDSNPGRSDGNLTAGRSLHAPPGIVANSPAPASRGSGATNPEIRYVDTYRRSDGRTVQGHYRTRADSNTRNNFSSSGNVNPTNGRRGYR